MEFSWTSFILEIINFLALVWLLKHFFYQPIQNIISARQKKTDAALDDAAKRLAEAEKMQEDYARRLQDWDKEREEKRQDLNQTLLVWKSQEEEKFKQSLAKDAEKIKARQQQQIEAAVENSQKKAMIEASLFASKLLKALASPALEADLIDITLKELKQLPAQQLSLLHQLEEGAVLKIESAYPLSEKQQQDIQAAVATLVSRAVDCEFSQDKKLIAGLHMALGDFSVAANIRDELRFFTTMDNGSHGSPNEAA